MIIDKELYMANALDVKSASRVVSTTIDQVKAGDARGGRELVLRIQVTTAFTRAAGAVDSVFSLETHTIDDFSAERTVLWKSGVIAKADLVAGHVVADVKIPKGALQFIAVVVDNVNAADAANIDAFLVPDSPDV